MRSQRQTFELKIKNVVILLVFGWGLCAGAVAQTPPPALPALSALPPLGALPAPKNSDVAPAVAKPPANEVPFGAALTPASPASPASPVSPLASLPKPYDIATPAAGDAASPPSQNATLPIAPLPALESSDAHATKAPSSPDGVAVALPAIAPISEEGAPPADAPVASLPALPPPLPPTGTNPQATALGNVVALPEVHVADEVAAPKSWEKPLAQAYVPPETNFRYKRVVLPEAIYRTDYDRSNQHLPKRITRDDYAYLLFTSVAKNDVEATRALLNAGTSINVTTPNGETPLALAKRAGAVDVAALLAARGAVE